MGGSPSTEEEDCDPGIVVVFGSGHADIQEAADESGSVRRWLCNDKRTVLEALEAAERLCRLSESTPDGSDGGRRIDLDISQVPWSFDSKATQPKPVIKFPG